MEKRKGLGEKGGRGEGGGGLIMRCLLILQAILHYESLTRFFF